MMDVKGPQGLAEKVAGWFADGAAFERANALWDPVSRAAFARAAPEPGETVLDACCGAGAFTIPAARAVGPQGRVVGVDLSDELVRRLMLRAHAEALTWVHGEVADVTTYGEAASFDLVACVLGVFFLPDMDSAGRHLVSRARSGGRVCVTTWALGALRQLMPHLVQAASLHRPELAEQPGHAPAERVQTPDGLAGYLDAIGLVEVQVERVDIEVGLNVGLALALLDGSAGRALVDGLDEPTRQAVREDVARRVQDATDTVLDSSVLVGTGRRWGG